MNPRLISLCAFLIGAAPSLFGQGKVLLVLGSDTAIWDGMDVSRYNCTYALSLYTDPLRNAALVMDPAFRDPLRDSYGRPVTFTWWMMQGNIFRYATNTNVPHQNSMALHLMKKYQGNAIAAYGDELTLHYHTFVWSDYDKDGKWYWNQALNFTESSDDFDVTLAEMLLEEETFPVSFRSGWHAMDNEWQRRLDQLLPYNMHNAWPAKRTDLTEPLDNTYDWSRSPNTFVPFHPSLDDYQVPGNAHGWNLRCAYMSEADSSFMARIFARAAAGIDQVVCLWAHLPEADFLQNVRKIDSSAHKAATRYPAVTFRYCTAVEAMQRWRGTADTARPAVTFEEVGNSDPAVWQVTVDEPIFQAEPFIALKDRYEQYALLPATRISPNVWQATAGVARSDMAKVGVAVTDTAGNLSLRILRYLPEEIFIDDIDPGFSPVAGSWSPSASTSWGTSSRQAAIAPSGSAAASWAPGTFASALYNVFVQTPSVPAAGSRIVFRLLEYGLPVDSVEVTGSFTPNSWRYLFTRVLDPASTPAITMTVTAGSTAGVTAYADVVKLSPLVRDRWVTVPPEVDGGEPIADEAGVFLVTVENRGIAPATIHSAGSLTGLLSLTTPMPCVVPAMGRQNLEFAWTPADTGNVTDTLIVNSDDPLRPAQISHFRAHVRHYFRIVDDRDSLEYSEYGSWSFSNARAYGPTSRYISPSASAGYSATFAFAPARSGWYTIDAIVPTTVNASNRARYVLTAGGSAVDSLFIDQNAGSGNWVPLMAREFAAGVPVAVKVSDAMNPVVPGLVLRADAIRFQWHPNATAVRDEPVEPLPWTSDLKQNSPNPFNPSTLLRFRTAGAGRVELTVHDLLGREVARVVDRVLQPGDHEARFDASGLASGVYLALLRTDGFRKAIKMTLLR